MICSWLEVRTFAWLVEGTDDNLLSSNETKSRRRVSFWRWTKSEGRCWSTKIDEKKQNEKERKKRRVKHYIILIWWSVNGNVRWFSLDYNTTKITLLKVEDNIYQRGLFGEFWNCWDCWMFSHTCHTSRDHFLSLASVGVSVNVNSQDHEMFNLGVILQNIFKV